MVFSILVIIISALYLAILELSKNTILGWIIGIMAMVLMIIVRLKLSSKMQGILKSNLILWIGFFAILTANYFFTSPPYKNVPAVDNKNPEVTEVIHISQGDLTGVYNADKSVRVYAGIPYAKPPVGELRFKEPQKPDPWEGIKSCDSFGPMAMQVRNSPLVDSLSHIVGWHDYQVKIGDEFLEPVSEDCLYLNVFAPENHLDEPLPVIFYIHGGSLTTGQSSFSEYRGEDLAKRGVIFVNFAYRLGVFGYYAAEDLAEESPNGTTGNYGLLDQIAALNWVRENISAFGGDPNQITIAGESAGASSVNALCVSPLTEGLFNYAIAESSGITAVKPYHTFRSYEEAIEAGDAVRKHFKVSSSDELRAISASELLDNPSEQNAMTVDGYAIVEPPYLTYEKGQNHERALLNGFNAKESDVFMLSDKVTKENYEEYLAERIGDQAAEMVKLVPADSPQRDQHFVVDVMGDAKGAANIAFSAIWFSYSHYLWNNYLIDQGVPAYEYYFTKTNNILSNYHSGELPYAYGNLWRHPGLYSEEDYKLSEIMQQYWVNFARTGNPNGDGLPEWQPRTDTQNQLLQLDSEIKMIDDPNEFLYGVIDKYQESIK